MTPICRLTLCATTAAGLLCTSLALRAQGVLPGFSPTPVLAGDPYSLPVGRWFIEASTTAASAVVDAAFNPDQHWAVGAQNGGLAAPSEAALRVGAKQASAASTVTATSVGVSANAGNALDAFSTLSAATAVSAITYWALLPSADAVTLDFHLTGSLQTTGARALGSDPSRAGVAVVGLGSLADPAPGAYNTLFSNIGLVPVGGEFTVEQYAAWPTSLQRNLATYGAQANSANPVKAVDASFSVTADGTRLNCAVGLMPACGNYLFMVTVFMVAGAENGGIADFSHTLSVDTLHSGSGATSVFAPAAMAPVPEPGSALLLLAGLAGLVGAVRRQRRRS